MELGNFKDKRVGCLLFKKFNFINVDMSRHNYEFKRKKYYLQAMNKIEKKKICAGEIGTYFLQIFKIHCFVLLRFHQTFLKLHCIQAKTES